MRILLLASAAALSLAAFAPAQAMPITKSAGISSEASVTDVAWRRHHRHYRRHYMRRGHRTNLGTGLPGRGPARDMSKTDGGRANDR
jgi:hypothetical protein